MRPVQVAAWLLKQSFLQHIHFQWLHRIWRNRLEHRKYSRTFFNGPFWRERVCERSVVFVLRENWVRLSRFFAHASPLRVVVKIAWAAFSLVLFKSLKWAQVWSMVTDAFFPADFYFHNETCLKDLASYYYFLGRTVSFSGEPDFSQTYSSYNVLPNKN